MAKTFSESEWQTIHDFAATNAEKFGLPERRDDSVVIGSFNIRKFGKPENKSNNAWKMIEMICKRFDLLAIQEVSDNLDALRHLMRLLGPDYGMAVSDMTGVYPGESGNSERLAFVFNWQRVSRTEMASDITYDRTKVSNTLFDKRDDFFQSFREHDQKRQEIDEENVLRLQQNKKKKPYPPVPNPHFVTFIRQPHCASFLVESKGAGKPYEILAVNCHLLYGIDPKERRREFDALISWLLDRAKNPKRMYYENFLMMGDCNLEFENPDAERPALESYLKTLNRDELSTSKAAKLNFPLFDIHPGCEEQFRTNARMNETYDQIVIAFRDKRLPDHTMNEKAGETPDGYDYGVFNFVEMFSQALKQRSFKKDFSKTEQRNFVKFFEHDLTDHMPVWIRLPLPE